MPELICSVPIPKNSQELEQAIQHYRETDLEGIELYCEFEAICEASLRLDFPELESDLVSGEDSY